MISREIRLWVNNEKDMPQKFNFHVETTEDAIDMLYTYEVAKVSLDYDLGSDLNGYKLACWIEKKAAEGLPRLQWEVRSKPSVPLKQMTDALLMADRYWDAVDATIKNHPSYNIVKEFLDETAIGSGADSLEWFRVRHAELGNLTPFQLILNKNSGSEKKLRDYILKELDLSEDLMDKWIIKE